MKFRDKLIATLRAAQPVLSVPGVMVVGSEVPNLLEERVAATLVVSQDVDIGIPVERHDAVKERLDEIEGLVPSSDEPSVWVPERDNLIEINFLGVDRSLSHPSETYVFADDRLPLMVFGPLSWMRPGPPLEVAGMLVPVANRAGLLLEKLTTDRSGVKGDRDLLVVAGLFAVAVQDDLQEISEAYAGLDQDLRLAVRSNLTLLSLLEPLEGMPDPRRCRRQVRDLLCHLEATEEDRG